MTDNYIQLKKDDLLRIKIIDADGNDTGNVLTFDIMDVELQLRLQECYRLHKKNFDNIKNRLLIISKKEDHKGKQPLSKNEEEEALAIKEFYDKEIEALDLFLGEGGTRKMLNGRSFNLYTFDEILDELKPITNLMANQKELITKKIKEKYSISEEEVLK